MRRGGFPKPTQGSSPLARGLQDLSDAFYPRTGIIPARAGFTDSPPRRPCSTTDHPRSRGVYSAPVIVIGSPGGSSPLARGLPPAGRMPGGLSRIIPARAGFTQPGRPRYPRSSDHPRSRGVYGDGRHLDGRATGSSPLARGLPDHVHEAHRVPGIIPARAGFTTRVSSTGRRDLDHPRSRGVYAVQVTRLTPTKGSSPLARGLPDAGERTEAVRGIIPARAGFTDRFGGRRLREPDHPRSRGVYSCGRLGFRMRRGSSPLARGLLGLGDDRRHRGGIIPARAGFTTLQTTPHSRKRDHPRSRGVYPMSKQS